MVHISVVEAFGWQRCLRLANEVAEVLVSLEVGPRILSYRLLAGENVLRTFPEQMGRQGEADFQVRGGHRLWLAPEQPLSYAPDNTAVEWDQEGTAVKLTTPPTAEVSVRKVLTLSLPDEGSHLRVEHRLTNESRAELQLASWGLTVMRPGGWEIIPQPPLGSHDTDLLPERVVVPWSYTDFSDPRWRFGPRYWRLTPRAGLLATKLGFGLPNGWAGYVLPDALFIKAFAFERGARYPDFGCNFETFAKEEFIELEALSTLRPLAPGESVGHVEDWHLFAGTPPGAEVEDAALADWLEPMLAPIGLR